MLRSWLAKSTRDPYRYCVYFPFSAVRLKALKEIQQEIQVSSPVGSFPRENVAGPSAGLLAMQYAKNLLVMSRFCARATAQRTLFSWLYSLTWAS